MTSSASPADVSSTQSRVIARKYRLDSLLGEGGMGSVWRAFNLQLEAPVAIKLLRAELDQGELGERLRVEARAAAKLVHPHIVRVFDVDESEQGEPFIVMELLDGETLRSLLDRGPLPAIKALQLLLPVAEALSLAHSRGVVHRDIKPDNVFLARVGDSVQPKLLDFGIAKVTSTAAVGGATITCTGTVLGSPEYMSPEQAMGRTDIDHRSDVWSFCVLLYEALSGRSPFAGEGTQEVLRAVVQDTPVPLELVAEVEPRLAALITSGMAKEPSARPQSIFELGQALASWLLEQGAIEDATGAALDFKWLGRSAEAGLLSYSPGSAEPNAKHDHATLVSVVHPGPPPGFTPPPTKGSRRPRFARVATAAVAAAALLGCAGWVALTHSEPPLVATSSPPPTSLVSPRINAAMSPAVAAAAAPLASPSQVVALADLPLEPAAAEPSAQPPAARPASATRAQRPPVAATRPRAGSLPRSLPPVNTRREGAGDLINPY